MTCGGCEKHVYDAVHDVEGVYEVAASSYADKNTVVTFNADQTSPEDIVAAIGKTGYVVTDFTISPTPNNEAL